MGLASASIAEETDSSDALTFWIAVPLTMLRNTLFSFVPDKDHF